MNPTIEQLIFTSKSKIVQKTAHGLENILTKIFENTENEEYDDLRSELNTGRENIDYAHASTILHLESDKFEDNSIEIRYEILNKQSKEELGYYALVWDRAWQLIEEFFVLN